MEQIKNRVHPDPPDSHGGILLKQIFRDRVALFDVDEDVPAACRIGVDEIQFKPFRAAGEFLRCVFLRKSERLFRIIHFTFLRNMLADPLTEKSRSFAFFRSQRHVFQFPAGGFEGAEFRPEEIFFFERVGKLFRSPVQKLEKLAVVEKVPVRADDRQVAEKQPLRVDFMRHRKSQLRRGIKNGLLRTLKNFCKFRRRNVFPVSPEESLPFDRKMFETDRNRCVSHRQITDIHKIDPCLFLRMIQRQNI